MSLPKKRKRLDENKTEVNEPKGKSLNPGQEGLSGRPSEVPLPEPERGEQMDRAFEIINHIEHVHGAETMDKNGSSDIYTNCSGNVCSSSHTPEGLRLKMSLIPSPSGTNFKSDEKGQAVIPVLELNLKIPSFFWKVPVLKGLTENLVRRLSKE